MNEVTGAGAWRLADDLVLARVAADLLGNDRAVGLGRYRIERDLGEGGMGRLLLAYDPDLQRHVALKLIAPARAGSDEARRRIVAEARAMARLSDPNVAQVYEVGEHEGQIYVAMEYIDGDSLAVWLAAERRSWVAIVEMFRQAGAGLAAAHAHGIVHRDFKPDNVMIDRGGRARVIDFGLAQGATTIAGSDARPHGALALTRTGAMLGTPAYMAPEQWDGGLVDPRTDQFAFCVALFEAIVGRHPFAGANNDDLRRALASGPIGEWPRRAPRWLHGALLRGLAIDPDRRWPDMPGLLAAIDAARRRRRVIAAAAGVAIVGLSGTSLAMARDACADAGAEMDAVWGSRPRTAVIATAEIVDPRWGPTTGERLVTVFDDLDHRWRAAAHTVCVAARTPSPPPIGAHGCLAFARDRLAEAIDEAERGAPELLVSAVARAELLPDPAACTTMSGWVEPIGDVTRVIGALAAAELHLGVTSVRGDPSVQRDAQRDARAEVELALAAATEMDHPALSARALALAGRLHLAEGEPQATESLLQRALAAAERSGEARLAAAISADLVFVIGREQPRLREADDLAQATEGAIAALGDPPLLLARLLGHRAAAAARGDAVGSDAIELHERVVALLGDTLGSAHPTTIIARGNAGAALSRAGRHDEAEAVLAAALVDAQAVWGDEHPRTAGLLGARGLARMRAGELALAEADLRPALELRLRILGDEHPQVDQSRYDLALLLRRRSAHAEAVSLLRTGAAHLRARVGADDARLGPWWSAAGESSLALGELAAARVELDEALRIFARTGADAGDYARIRLASARAWQPVDPARARVLAELARADAREAGSERRSAEIDALLAELSR